MAQIADDRLRRVARIDGSAKPTPATIRVQDVPGTGAALLGNLRRVDALLCVVDGFSPGADPARDLEQLVLELLVADRDHVEARLERVRTLAKSGDRGCALRRLRLRPCSPISIPEARWAIRGGGARGARAADDEAPGGGRERSRRDRSRVRARARGAGGRGGRVPREGPSALEEVVRRLRDALDLITFFTGGETEARAWTLRKGQTALDAAAEIHSDIARGFIRCEVIHVGDLVESGSRAEAARRGLQRLEGKGYVVADGDVLHIQVSP